VYHSALFKRQLSSHLVLGEPCTILYGSVENNTRNNSIVSRLRFPWKYPTPPPRNIFRNPQGEKGLENQLGGAEWREIHSWVETVAKNPPKPTKTPTTAVTSLLWFVRNSLFNKKEIVHREESELKFSQCEDKCECTKKGFKILSDHQKAPPITCPLKAEKQLFAVSPKSLCTDGTWKCLMNHPSSHQAQPRLAWSPL